MSASMSHRTQTNDEGTHGDTPRRAAAAGPTGESSAAAEYERRNKAHRGRIACAANAATTDVALIHLDLAGQRHACAAAVPERSGGSEGSLHVVPRTGHRAQRAGDLQSRREHY